MAPYSLSGIIQYPKLICKDTTCRQTKIFTVAAKLKVQYSCTPDLEWVQGLECAV